MGLHICSAEQFRSQHVKNEACIFWIVSSSQTLIMVISQNLLIHCKPLVCFFMNILFIMSNVIYGVEHGDQDFNTLLGKLLSFICIDAYRRVLISRHECMITGQHLFVVIDRLSLHYSEHKQAMLPAEIWQISLLTFKLYKIWQMFAPISYACQCFEPPRRKQNLLCDVLWLSIHCNCHQHPKSDHHWREYVAWRMTAYVTEYKYGTIQSGVWYCSL